MSTKFINICPSCGNEMSITTLSCKNCGIDIKGDFEIPAGTSTLSLSDNELSFLKLFLKHEGNITKIQEELGIGYFAVKGKLKTLNIKLGNEMEVGMENYKEKVESTGKGLPSQRIIGLLNEMGGSSECQMLRGEPLKIWLTEEGVRNSGFPELVCKWEIFDAIVEKAKELGGRMYRGDSAAQNGAKIGSKQLPLDTIDAFISIKFYGNEEGKSTLRRSTYYAAILAWAEICSNRRSDGNGGYIEICPKWMN